MAAIIYFNLGFYWCIPWWLTATRSATAKSPITSFLEMVYFILSILIAFFTGYQKKDKELLDSDQQSLDQFQQNKIKSLEKCTMHIATRQKQEKMIDARSAPIFFCICRSISYTLGLLHFCCSFVSSQSYAQQTERDFSKQYHSNAPVNEKSVMTANVSQTKSHSTSNRIQDQAISIEVPSNVNLPYIIIFLAVGVVIGALLFLVITLSFFLVMRSKMFKKIILAFLPKGIRKSVRRW